MNKRTLKLLQLFLTLILVAIGNYSSEAIGEETYGVIDLDDTITPNCTSFTHSISPEQIAAFQPLFTQRGHRLWHVFFGGLRARWTSFSQQEKDVIQAIHPVLVPPNPTDVNPNLAGEDFMFLHRQMILMVRDALVDARLPCISDWTSIPKVDDPVFPMPPGWSGQNFFFAFSKSTTGYNDLVLRERNNFHNDSWLKQQADFGAMIHELETTSHGIFHFRWGAKQTLPARPYLTINGPPAAEYNSTDYVHLADTYSSMSNPHFWKIHGYIADVAFRWLKLHGYTKLAQNCPVDASGKKDPTCYQWRSTWVGPDPEVICGCGHHEPGEVHVHEKDVYDLFTSYAAKYPTKKLLLDNLLRKIDQFSAPGNPN